MGFLLAFTLLLAPSMFAADPLPGPLEIAAVKASSTLPPWKGYTFDAANLIDGRLDTSWQPAKNDTLGVGQWVELDLGATYEISRIEIEQGLQKVDPTLGDLWCRNNRYLEAYVFLDDGSFGPDEADAGKTTSGTESFFRGVPLAGTGGKGTARHLRLVVKSVNEPVDWEDLAVAEIRVWGKPTTAPQVDATSIGWTAPGAWPLKVAIIDYCASNAARRAQHDCGALLLAIAKGQVFNEARYRPVAPIAVADLEKGHVVLAFTSDDVTSRMELVRGRDGRWSVKSQTRVDAAGKPAPPVPDPLFERDVEARNKCWEKLGKTRPEPSDEESYPR